MSITDESKGHFSTIDSCAGPPSARSLIPNDLRDYASYASHECPLCNAGVKLDAFVNCFGYSKL